jgi:CheY-like chemotaxis protein
MGHTILLADDSVTIRRIVELAFRDTDIRVDAVGSGHEAIERFEALRPELVLADVVMPPPTGYDLCRAIKATAPGVPVLLLRGSFEPFDEQRAAAVGADGHVGKPFEADRLVDRVRELLRSGVRPSVPAKPAPVPGTDVALVEADTERVHEDVSGVSSADDGTTARQTAPRFGPEDEVEEALEDLASGSTEPRPVRVGSTGPSAGDDGGAGGAAGQTEPPRNLPVGDVTQPIPIDVRDAVTSVPVRHAAAPRATTPAPAATSVGSPRTCPDRDAVAPDERLVEAVARRVVEKLCDRVVREIAWDVVPDLATAMIRERLRQLEGEDPDAS